MGCSIRGGRKASLSVQAGWVSSVALLAGLVFTSSSALAEPPLAGRNPARLPYLPDGPFIETSVFAADNVLPVASIIDDSWRGDFTPENRNAAELYWNAAAGVVVNGWRVAAFNRAEFFIESNRDAIEFIYLTKKKRDLATNRIYAADLKATGFIANGVEVSHGRKLDRVTPGLSAGFTVRLMDPTYLQDGSMSGYVIPLGPRSYDYNLFLDYAYSKNIIYDREGEHLGDGYGFSADIGVSYRKGGWRADALLRDLAGAIYWRSAPYTTANAVTPTTSTSTNGYQDFTPSINGYEGNKRFRQAIPLKTDLSLGYDYDCLSASATVILIRDQPRTWFEGGYKLNDRVRLSLAYNLDYSALSYGIAAYGFELGLTMDGTEVRDANALGFRMSYLYNW